MDVLDGQYHYQVLLNIKHCSPLTRRIDIHERCGYTEFQFSNGGYDDVILVKAGAGFLEADYYRSKNRVKNPTLEL